MRNLFWVIPAFFIPIMAGCAGGKKTTGVTTERVSGAMITKDFTAIYNLPRTSLLVTVETTRELTKRGPYFQFAEKYLGISGVTSMDAESWYISGVSIHALEEADPDNYFVLVSKNGRAHNYLKLVSEGFILPATHQPIGLQPARFQSQRGESGDLVFTDMSVKKVVFQETQSSMRLMQQDTAFISVPVLRKEVVRKSLEDKAREAADFIIDLRMNRFKLISGEYDLFPDGKAMEAILEEYKRLEEDYLSLFIGKTFRQTRSAVFEYTPTGNEPLERTFLFRFSDNKGILAEGDLSGRPVALEITRENRVEAIRGLNFPLKDDKKHGRIYYRIPDVANIQLIDGRTVIARNRLPVSQFGKIVSVPSDFRWE